MNKPVRIAIYRQHRIIRMRLFRSVFRCFSFSSFSRYPRPVTRRTTGSSRKASIRIISAVLTQSFPVRRKNSVRPASKKSVSGRIVSVWRNSPALILFPSFL